MPNKPMAFTLAAPGILRELKTEVLIISNHCIPNTTYTPAMRTALWDTGASSSTISPRVVSELHLMPIGKTNVSTANGVVAVNTYMVDIGLPNKIMVKDVLVACADIGTEIDALIGMDIITLGDFSITNVNKNTKFSFRIPSLEEVDYVQQMNANKKV